MRKSSAITIFLSLIFVCIIALICSLVESARTAGVRFYLQTATDSAIDSVFSEFDNGLWEEYRLILRELENDEEAKSSFEKYLNPYFEEDGIYSISEPNIEIIDKQMLIDEGGAWLENEIADYMKYKVVEDLIFNMRPDMIWEEVKQAEIMQNITSDYSKYSNLALKLEKCIIRISENLEEQRECQKEAEGYIGSGTMEEFIEEAERLSRKNQKLDQLIDDYSKKADRLEKEFSKSEEKRSKEWDKLTIENQSILQEQLDACCLYVNQDGERRREIEGLRNQILEIEGKIEEAIILAEAIQEAEEEEENDEEESDDIEEDEDNEEEEIEELQEGVPEEAYDILLETWSEISIHTLTFDYGLGDENKATLLENIIDTFSGNILELIIPSDRDISKQKIHLGNMPSKIDRTVRTEPEADILKTILISQYAGDYFPDFVDKVEDDFAYELEYILSGQESDKKNLEGAITKLLLVRQCLNYVHLVTDMDKMNTVKDIATSITESVPHPLVAAILVVLVISAWVLAESVLDVRDLLAGKKVPLFKTAEEWKLDKDSLFGLGEDKNKIKEIGFIDTKKMKESEEMGGYNERGLDYKMYLKILLFMESSENRNYRMMDMIQHNMKKKDTKFQIRNMLYAMRVKTQCRSDRIFSRLSLVHGALLGISAYYDVKVESVKAY